MSDFSIVFDELSKLRNDRLSHEEITELDEIRTVADEVRELEPKEFTITTT